MERAGLNSACVHDASPSLRCKSGEPRGFSSFPPQLWSSLATDTPGTGLILPWTLTPRSWISLRQSTPSRVLVMCGSHPGHTRWV